MYNRYIRNDDGVYRRVPVPESSPGDFSPGHGGPPQSHGSPEPHQSRGIRPSHSPGHAAESLQGADPARHPLHAEGREKQGLLSSLLDRLKPDKIDSGDLLLLAILFLLFMDGGDEELLIALALLLIL